MAVFCRLGFRRHLHQSQGKLLKAVSLVSESSRGVDRFVRHLMVLSASERNPQLMTHQAWKSRQLLPQLCTNGCRNYAKKSKDKKGKPGVSKVELSADEMEGVLNLEAYRASLQHVVDQQKDEYIQHLTLRTTAGVFNTIKVHTDDGSFPINQLGQIAQKSPTLIMINLSASPQYIAAVKEAIINSGMNVNPQQEANTLFVPLPKVTKEHRENLAKSAKTLCDKTKERLRDVYNKQSRKLKQSKGDHSEDLLKKLQELILEEMQVYSEKAESMMKAKQNDLLGH